LPAIGVDENYIEESRSILAESHILAVKLDKFERNREIIYGREQGISKVALGARRIFAKRREENLAKEPELKVDELEHID
ncbi:hypothetical protein, partial [Pseudomonas lurida]|uniref:hypothetical protein n=1 Tax=Pseudomonas lurida TaxID=244566 RepID=UPI0034D95F55